MNSQQVTITLPETLYERVKRRSQQTQRSVADELTAVVAASLPEEESLPPDIEQELSELDLFTTEELWRAARMTAPVGKTERMQVLVEKQQLEGLTDSEKQEAALLSHFFNRVMLIRAKAAVLLKERGHDVDQLLNIPSADA
jgi:tRNA(Met) C34 N-acetyltransferase TmcA